MKYYFAPLEGVTGYIYRNAHRRFFGGTDKYFTPFIVPTQTKKLAPKELKDVSPERNKGLVIIPQILTNRFEDFICTAGELKKLGYDEINLNLGCPSRTVVSKNRGSGFLALTDELDRFLYEIFPALDMKISIKTRIGKVVPEEFYELIEIFNKYPLEELIIHPRLQTDYYKNHPDMEVFRDAVRLSKNPLCYNGDIFTAGDYENFTEAFPEVEAVMLGRGLIANPCLFEEIKGQSFLDKQRFMAFHDEILGGYSEAVSGERNVLFKMKELWIYMSCVFDDSGKYAKKIRKAERMGDYLDAVHRLVEEKEIVQGAGYTVMK